MISHWFLLVLALGLTIDGFELNNELSSLSQIYTSELESDTIESDTQDYDVSDGLDQIEDEVAELMQKLESYQYKKGPARKVVCHGPRLCFLFTNNQKAPVQYCLKMENGNCVIDPKKVIKPKRTKSCMRFQKLRRASYVRVCKICVGKRCKTEKEKCKKIKTNKNRTQSCLTK